MDQLLDDSGHVLDQNGANVQAVDMVQHSMDDVHGQDDGIDANQLTDITYTQAEESARLILLQKEFPSREAAQFAIQQHHVQFTAPMEDEMRGNVVYHKQKQNRKRESYEYWKRGDHNIPTCPWKAEVSCMGTLHTGGKVYQVTNLMYESQHSHQGNSVKRMRSIGVRDVKNESQMGQGQHPDDLIGGSDPNAIPVPLEQPIVRKRQSKRPRKDNQEMSIPMAIPMNMDSQHVGTQAVRADTDPAAYDQMHVVMAANSMQQPGEVPIYASPDVFIRQEIQNQLREELQLQFDNMTNLIFQRVMNAFQQQQK